MGEPRDCLTGVKSDREREIYDITYMWNLKNGTTEFIYSRVTDVENMDCFGVKCPIDIN